MARFNAHLDDFDVKAPDSATALRSAQKRAPGLIRVTKVVLPPVVPGPVKGLRKLWADDCSNATPVESGRFGEYAMQRRDGVQATSSRIAELHLVDLLGIQRWSLRQTLLRVLCAPRRQYLG